MDSAARRRQIVEAATPLFARYGLAGVTTRQIADAAGISEALLFRHFPTKAALYQEILHLGCRGDPDLNPLETLAPSTATLVLMVHGLVRHIVFGELGDPDLLVTRMRLVLTSIMEDGENARIHFANVAERILPTFAASMAAAEQAGDLQSPSIAPANAFWFADHVACQIAQSRLSGRDTIPYQGDLEAIAADAVRFILRGIGLRDEVIAAGFDPSALAIFQCPRDDADQPATGLAPSSE